MNVWIEMEYQDKYGRLIKHTFSAHSKKRLNDVLSVQHVLPHQILKINVNGSEMDYKSLITLLEG